MSPHWSEVLPNSLAYPWLWTLGTKIFWEIDIESIVPATQSKEFHSAVRNVALHDSFRSCCKCANLLRCKRCFSFPEGIIVVFYWPTLKQRWSAATIQQKSWQHEVKNKSKEPALYAVLYFPHPVGGDVMLWVFSSGQRGNMHSHSVLLPFTASAYLDAFAWDSKKNNKMWGQFQLVRWKYLGICPGQDSLTLLALIA